MKMAILGAGGVRTPLIVEAIMRRQASIGLTELALMDIDADRLQSIGALTSPLEQSGQLQFTLVRTTDPRGALADADFVITTFRVGGIASRVVDESIPLRYGVIGQETTGPGGFAMAMRTIPVLLGYLDLMRELCPTAWLINFANPAGMLAEAAYTVGKWPRTVGICDAPHTMGHIAAMILGVPADELYLDYFGLNHLGWIRAVRHNAHDYLPQFLAQVRQRGELPGLPFSGELMATLGLIPNEYLYYYYYCRKAVENALRSEQTRGEQIAAWNQALFIELARLRADGDIERMLAVYHAYLAQRGETYMVGETGHTNGLANLDPALAGLFAGEGYAGVALDLIEGLVGSRPGHLVLNVPNRGAIDGMAENDVVEVPTYASKGLLQPLAVGSVPTGPFGLMQQVKHYEHLTIAAATEGSYAKALQALTVHPLVRDYTIAAAILDDYRQAHAGLFPALT